MAQKTIQGQPLFLLFFVASLIVVTCQEEELNLSPDVADAEEPCKTMGFCDDCTSTASSFGNCRWCPGKWDNQCHSTGSVFNACPKSSDNIKNPSKCPPRPTRKTGYDPTWSVNMTAYAFATYHPNPCFSYYLPPDYASNCQNFTAVMPSIFGGDPSKPQTVVATVGYEATSNIIVLALRGTTSGWQLIDEAAASYLVQMPGADDGVGVNAYFGAAAGLLKEQMGDYSVITNLMAAHPTAPLYITGHSLGGGMATVMALDMMLTKTLTIAPTLYTYGQPRSGNNKFSQLFNSLIPFLFRVVNANDVVPHIPACSKTCRNCNYGEACASWRGYACCNPNADNYYHSGTEIWYPAGEYQNGVMCQYRECLGSPLGEDASCSNRYIETSKTPHGAYEDVLQYGYCCGPMDPMDGSCNPKIPLNDNIVPQEGNSSGMF